MVLINLNLESINFVRTSEQRNRKFTPLKRKLTQKSLMIMNNQSKSKKRQQNVLDSNDDDSNSFYKDNYPNIFNEKKKKRKKRHHNVSSHINNNDYDNNDNGNRINNEYRHQTEIKSSSMAIPTPLSSKQSSSSLSSSKQSLSKQSSSASSSPSSSLLSSSSSSLTSSISSKWNFITEYNDHFETPLNAYRDLLPLLQSLAVKINKKIHDIIIFDPYYCDGMMKKYLNELGR